MPSNNPPDVGQTNPGPFELPGAVQPLDVKELIRILHVELHCVVPDEHYALFPFLIQARDSRRDRIEEVKPWYVLV
jgi:hypothetical protein